MITPSPKFAAFWNPKRRNLPQISDPFSEEAAPILTPSYAMPRFGDRRFRFLVHTRLVVDNTIDDYYWPSRSGIIDINKDIGINGLKDEILSLLRSNKFADDRMAWQQYINPGILAIRVKWMPEARSQRVPDAVLETDSEVRSAIEFMAERRGRDHFSVTCYLTSKFEAVDNDTDENEGNNTAEEEDERQFQEFLDKKKKTTSPRWNLALRGAGQLRGKPK
jgi:hypothetical protein